MKKELSETELTWTRRNGVESLISYVTNKGAVIASDLISFEIDNSYGGSTKAIAINSIPQSTHLIHLPTKFDLSYEILHKEVQGCSWFDLEMSIRRFEINFEWSDNNTTQIDDFGKNMKFVVCILGLIQKLKGYKEGELMSDSLVIFQKYW